MYPFAEWLSRLIDFQNGRWLLGAGIVGLILLSLPELVPLYTGIAKALPFNKETKEIIVNAISGTQHWPKRTRYIIGVLVVMVIAVGGILASYGWKPIDDKLVVDQNQSGRIDVLENDLLPNKDIAEVAPIGSTSDQRGTVDCSSKGNCRYIPREDFVGQDNFDYEVKYPGGQSYGAQVKIQVNPLPATPTPTEIPPVPTGAPTSSELSINITTPSAPPITTPLSPTPSKPPTATMTPRPGDEATVSTNSSPTATSTAIVTSQPPETPTSTPTFIQIVFPTLTPTPIPIEVAVATPTPPPLDTAQASGGVLAFSVFNDKVDAHKIYIARFPEEGEVISGEDSQILNFARQPMFRRDGRTLTMRVFGFQQGVYYNFYSRDNTPSCSINNRPNARWPVWSPDGQELIFVDVDEEEPNNSTLYRLSNQFEQLIQSDQCPSSFPHATPLMLGDKPITGQHVLWSNEGYLVFRGCATWIDDYSICGIWRTDANTLNPLELIIENDQRYPMDVGHNLLAYMSAEDGDWDIYLIALNDDNAPPRNITDNNFQDGLPAISPDGERVAYISDKGLGQGQWGLRIINIKDETERFLGKIDFLPNDVIDVDLWSGDKMSWTQ